VQVFRRLLPRSFVRIEHLVPERWHAGIEYRRERRRLVPVPQLKQTPVKPEDGRHILATRVPQRL